LNVISALTNAKDSITPALAILEETVEQVDHHTAITPQMRNFVCRSLLRGGQILDSINLLVACARHQDIWVLCRTLCELAINTCYLQVAPEIEFTRWSNYDLWTDERLILNLSSLVPGLEDALDPKELQKQREQRKALEDSGIYKNLRGGSWSEKTMDERAKIADVPLHLTPGIFHTLYRLAVKIGDGFVHSSPKSLGAQKTPIVSPHGPSDAEMHATAQALSMAATSVYAAINFTRVRFGLPQHPLADRFADSLRIAYRDSGPF